MDLDKLQSTFDYNPHTGLFKWKVIGANGNYLPGDMAGGKKKDGYWWVSFECRRYKAHRLAWFYITGAWPSQVDHINRVRTDNRWINLRESNQSQNMINCGLRINNVSGVTGVHFDRANHNWVAYIKHNYKRIHIGRFQVKQDAIDARLNKELELFGEFSPNYRRVA